MKLSKKDSSHPPRWVDRLLEWLVSPDIREEVQGDLHEVFCQLVRERGRQEAERAYLLAVIQYLRPYFYQRKTRFAHRTKPHVTPQLYSDMIRSYFLLAFRNLRRHPAFTIINVIGLSLGITCSLLIFLLLREEFSYDRFFLNPPELIG